MYFAAFALLSAVASWAAWRQSPTYSARKALQYAAVIVLTVVALMTGAIGTSQLTEHAPLPIMLGSVWTVTLLGGLASIWATIRVSMPALPPLPRSVTVVGVYRQKLIPLLKRAGWATLVFVALGFALRGESQAVVLALGAIFGVLAIVMFFAAYIVAFDADRSLTSIEVSPWVHWHYSREEWTAWCDDESSRLAVASLPKPGERRTIGIVVILLVVTAIPFVLTYNAIPLLWETLFIGGLWALAFAIFAIANVSATNAPRRVHEALLRAQPDTYFGAAGMFADGAYVQWQTVSQYLVAATIDAGTPRRLTFTFEEIEPGVSAAVTRCHHVLVPLDADADLTLLQTAVSTLCPAASVALQAAGTCAR